MSEDLYPDALLALARDTSHAGRLEAHDASATADNPLCGDRVTIDVTLKGNGIAEVRHHTRGCVLCRAAASILAAKAEGSSRAAIAVAEAAVRAMLEKGDDLHGAWQELIVFNQVAPHKSRHGCVLLPFRAMSEALS
ncbi:MAG: iron-sulfur cluster assembly scaffold protein [Alphaproteobacteria bacterium]|nr:iron-sulfur cluster assembly scaffold protein [Alphaproteobacteria bacterium]